MEPHYRANHLSLRELGAMYDVRAPSIVKHAASQSPPWKRDLTAAIDARADELVNEAETLANTKANAEANKTRVLATSNVIQATATVIADVRLGQRSRFKHLSNLSIEMFMELDAQFRNRTDLRTLGELMEQVDDKGRPDELTKLYREVIELPDQIKALKDLTDIIAKITAMETVAYKLEKAPEGNDQARASLPVRFVDTPMVERVDDEDADLVDME